jgi:rhodanese-related sulfurtransferase
MAMDDLELSPADTIAALNDGSAVVVDVREDHERAEGHLDGDRHIPMNRLSEEASSLPGDTRLIFYCETGSRSLMAAQAFKASGLDARSMAGGMKRLTAEGLPQR